MIRHVVIARYLQFGFLLLSVALPFASRAEVTGRVTDVATHEPLPYASIKVASGMSTMADVNGIFHVQLPSDSALHTLTASYLGYEPRSIMVRDGQMANPALTPLSVQLGDVVVTATEGRSLTSSSTINRDAMEHVQPTSFADLLALLPGGSTSDPLMSSPTHIKLREAGVSDSDYDTGSLGVRFMVDGVPLITDANMQTVRQEMNSLYSYKTSVNSGVDMRALTTDNIESVEVIRGVPSVKYGEVTSGVVNIQRRLTSTPLEMRLKADYYGKLAYASKGFAVKNIMLMADAGFLDSRSDPRDRYGNYQRVNGSVRSELNSGDLRWTASLDYSGNIDSEKNDPDIETMPEDTYKASYHDVSLGTTLIWKPLAGSGTVKSVNFTLGASMAFDKLSRTRFTQLDRDRVAITAYEQGVNDGIFLPYKYVATLTVDGKPFNNFATLSASLRFRSGIISHSALAGLDWQLSKNFGKGEVYDLLRPLSPYSSSTRPRRFSDIPALRQLSAYIEDAASVSLLGVEATLRAGLRLISMPGIAPGYYIHGRVFVDPRANLQLQFPIFNVAGYPMTIDLTGGVGLMSKMPTADYLYPDKCYIDFTRLNYWNANPELRRINVQTYVVDPTNHDLRPARNFKSEIRLGAAWRGNRLSVTYFRENMKSGFRRMYVCAPYTFGRFDASGIDGNTLTAPPALAQLPSVADTVLSLHSTVTNGSRTFKEGVEFTFASTRIRAINTRITINGAWFRTRYENSVPGFQPANSATTIGNVAVNDKYMGYYEWSERYVRESFNTNITIDTDVPSLGLRFSVTPECTWFTASKNDPINGYPVAYMDVTGTIHPFTEESAADAWLTTLIRQYNETTFRRSVSPFYMYINLKATKSFGKHVKAAIFIDRLLDIVNNYHRNGMLVRRSAASPYFGMEINLSI